jgi:hypothetical protein
MELFDTISNLDKGKEEYLEKYLNDIKKFPFIYLW